MTKKIKIADKDYVIKVARYADNDRIYLGLYDKNGWCNDISVNLSFAPNFSLSQVYLSNDLTKEEKKALIKEGIIEKPTSRIPYNMSSYEVSKVDLEKLLEYDKVGIEDYYMAHGVYLDDEDENENEVNQTSEMER